MPMYLQLTGHRSSLMIHWTPVQFLVKPHIHPSFPWPLHVYIKHYMYILPVDINPRLKKMGTVIQLLIKCKKISPSVHADLLEPLSCNTEEHWYLQANLSVYFKNLSKMLLFSKVVKTFWSVCRAMEVKRNNKQDLHQLYPPPFPSSSKHMI